MKRKEQWKVGNWWRVLSYFSTRSRSWVMGISIVHYLAQMCQLNFRLHWKCEVISHEIKCFKIIKSFTLHKWINLLIPLTVLIFPKGMCVPKFFTLLNSYGPSCGLCSNTNLYYIYLYLKKQASSTKRHVKLRLYPCTIC